MVDSVNFNSKVSQGSTLTSSSSKSEGNLLGKRVVAMPKKGSKEGVGFCCVGVAVFLTIAIIGASLLIRYATQRQGMLVESADGYGFVSFMAHNPAYKTAGAILLGVGGGMTAVTGASALYFASRN